eukprot:evm.model.scf_876.3 EVM.evm.TU.scf_876.3   scf_876:14273-18197(-)
MKKIFGRGWSGKGMRDATVAPLVGKVVQVGHYRLKVEAHLGEGGFASIYRVKDLASGELFALKHLRLGSKETVEMVRHEAKVMNRLKGHPNVLRLISVAFGGEAGAETDAYMLLDLCPDNLFRYLQRKDFKVTDARLLEIFGAVCSAVAEMHSLEPPLTHRDVKVENVLRRPNNEWVLCDFGSSTTRERTYETPAEIGEEEENIRRHTTPAYRAPEMWDLYQRKRIDTRVDIWALGCVLYFLSYGKLPFSGDSKLQILNGNYQIPPRRPVPICSLIQDLLCVDPDQRPSIRTVVQRVAALQHYIHNAASNSADVDSSNHSLTPRDLAPVYSAPGMAAGSTSPMGAPLAQHSKWDQSNARHMEVGLTRQKSTPQPGNPFATAGPIPTPEPADKMSRQMSTPQPLPADKMSRQMSTPQPQGKSSWQTSHDNSCEYRMPAQQGGAVARASERPRSPGWADFDNPPSQHREPQERETMAGAKNARLPTEERQQEAYQAPDRGSQALEALRLRARGLEVENKALQVQVKQLQNVIASQQQTIQDLQQQNQRQQAQFEKAAAQYALEVSSLGIPGIAAGRMGSAYCCGDGLIAF